MKVQTFFEKYDQFANAPGGVAKMRELVLQLAVRGRLVPQNPKDEPAAKAIEGLVVLNGSGRTTRTLAEEEPVELPFDVPASWIWVRFGDLVRIRTGKLDANAAVPGGAYPFFTCSKTPSQIATYSFDTSAVILAGNGDFNLKSYSGKFDAYQRTYVIEPLGWELGFCFWLISAQIKRITDNQRGSAIPYLRLGDIADPLVPFPPLAEQRRIVAKVDELMALCDRLEAQQQERETRHAALARASLARFAYAPTPANLRFIFHPSYSIPPADLRKSILTIAVQGKLVPQDLEDEPATDLYEPDEELEARSSFEIPHGWVWTRLNNLAEINGGFAFKSAAYKEAGTRVVRISDFDEFGFKDHKVVRHPFAPDLQKFCLAKSNILMAMTGGTVGKSYLVKALPEPMVVNQRVATIKVVESANPSYIDIVIRSEMTQEVIRKAKNSTNDNISMGDIKGFAIPVPPLAEQCRIVAKVEQLMSLVDELETQLAAFRATAANLHSALVAELTAQEHSRAARSRSRQAA